MKINIQNLERNLLEVEGEIDSDFLGSEIRVFYPNRIKVSAKLDKFGKDYKIDVLIQTQAEYVCDRCLIQYTHDFNAQLNQVYHTGNRGEEVDADIIELPANAIEIDITPIINEAFVLHHPIKMVCQDNCQGMCTECGADLNREKCTCAEDAVDPRWAELKKIIK